MDVPLLRRNNCDFVLIQCQTKSAPCILLAIPVKRLVGEVYARLDYPVCSVNYRAWLTAPRKRVNLIQDPDTAYRFKIIPAVTVVMRKIPKLLRLTQVEAPDEAKGDLDSKLLVEAYGMELNFRNWGTGSVAWLQDQSSKDESFVYIFQLNTRVANKRIEDIIILSKCLFLKKNESNKNPPLEGLKWQVDALCAGYYEPELYNLFRKEPVPYEPIVTWDENFFGEMLITVDIRNAFDLSAQDRGHLVANKMDFHAAKL
ncbi:hypothetical protein N7493_001189 [Penicillium malachiteum]|uniref:Uncharacterized protein n=1 Tax=Penicillium malachiteum TaxID=1324776 RepID=A0AAD6MZG2_9EURO|nr:hypothetical protein N7493_001189 [Penicillium malachiteum]